MPNEWGEPTYDELRRMNEDAVRVIGLLLAKLGGHVELSESDIVGNPSRPIHRYAQESPRAIVLEFAVTEWGAA